MTLFQKYILRILGALALAYALFSIGGCEEIGPNIDLGTDVDTTLLDTTYVTTSIPAAQDRIVIVEDLTGVKCTNCPKGHSEGEDILDDHPGRAIVVSVHSIFLADPVYPTDPDLRIPEAEDIEQLLGPSPGKPSAGVDRYLFPSEQQLLKVLINPGSWKSLVNQRVNEPTRVNVDLTKTWDPLTRELHVFVEMTYTSDVTETNRISVMIMEDDVKAAQYQPDGSVDSTYLQKHVLRDMLTPSSGVLLSYDKTAGRVIIREFKITIPQEWDPANCKVIAFVHQSGASLEVEQAAYIDVE